MSEIFHYVSRDVNTELLNSELSMYSWISTPVKTCQVKNKGKNKGKMSMKRCNMKLFANFRHDRVIDRVVI